MGIRRKFRLRSLGGLRRVEVRVRVEWALGQERGLQLVVELVPALALAEEVLGRAGDRAWAGPGACAIRLILRCEVLEEVLGDGLGKLGLAFYELQVGPVLDEPLDEPGTEPEREPDRPLAGKQRDKNCEAMPYIAAAEE